MTLGILGVQREIDVVFKILLFFLWEGGGEGVLVVEGEGISSRALTFILFLLSTGGGAPCSLLRFWVCYWHSCTVCDSIVTCHRILCKYWTEDFNPPSLPPSL